MSLCLDRRVRHRPDRAEEERQDQAALQRQREDNGSNPVKFVGSSCSFHKWISY